MTGAALSSRARELGITAEDLDETIIDIANDGAARNVNAGGHYDKEHDAADSVAGEINQHGLDAQLAYLAQTLGPAATLRLIDSLAPRAASPLRVLTKAGL